MTDDSEKRAALKHWLGVRLTQGERPREQWRQLCEAAWDHLLQTPVHDLIDANATRILADQLTDPESMIESSRPVAAKWVRALIAELREDHEPLTRFTPTQARDRLHAALARPGLVHPDWVRATLRGEAVEAVLNDVLYRALKDFSTLLPRVLTNISPMGRFGILGSAGALAERLIGEVERLIEPEIRSFLADSTGRVLESAAEFTIARIDDPAQIEFRTALIDFVLSRSPAFLLANADETLIDDLESVVELTARHLAQAPETREAIDEWIDKVMEYCEGRTLGEVLEHSEHTARPPIDALADVTWPAYAAVLSSPQVREWTEALVDELIDEYDRSDRS